MMARAAATVEETPWWLDVNDVIVAAGSVTPERIEALAAGRLLAERYAFHKADLLTLKVEESPPGCIGVSARVPPELAQAAEIARRHRDERHCGPRHWLDCEPSALRVRAVAAGPPLDAFPDLFRELFAAAARSRETGGVHTAALSDGVSLRFQVEDVGRHNAVDKALGWGLLEGASLETLGLVVSSRISAEIALKAAQSGVAWIASRSIPTDLAVEIAERARLPIVARAPGNAHVFGAASNGDRAGGNAGERRVAR
jgi:FdhD protein